MGLHLVSTICERLTDRNYVFKASLILKKKLSEHYFFGFFTLASPWITLNTAATEAAWVKVAESSLRKGKVLLIRFACHKLFPVNNHTSLDFQSWGLWAEGLVCLNPQADGCPAGLRGGRQPSFRRPIRLSSSSLNSDPSLNEGSHTQGTLGRQPCEMSHRGDERRKPQKFKPWFNYSDFLSVLFIIWLWYFTLLISFTLFNK